MKLIVLVFVCCLAPFNVFAQGADRIGTDAAKDAADDYFTRMGDLSGTPEERGARIHDKAVDDRLESIEQSRGEAARLREERIYREQHKY